MSWIGLGAVHKVRHAILDQFWLPSLLSHCCSLQHLWIFWCAPSGFLVAL